jgi:hypothetical protein
LHTFISDIIIMKKLFTLFALLICLTNLKAQFVTIPDANFLAWLQANVSSAMNGNQMDTTSLAVTNRTRVNVENMGITDLTGIQYFDSLKSLNCSYNSLTYLSILPNSLDSLSISHNPISNLLSPKNLRFFSCSYCGLTTLPALSDSLIFLECYYNPISYLPNLPSKLITLNCGATSISSLPILPSNLRNLYCKSDTNLSFLPGLPNTIEQLDCEDCQILSLPQLPGSLKFLWCRRNSLTSLPALPKNLIVLAIVGNQISCLPTLPESLQYLQIMPNNQIYCLPNYIPAMDASYFSIPLCVPGNTVTNPNSCSKADGIFGNSYFDTNTNCQYDTTDIKLKNIKFKLYDSNNNYLNQASSYSNGVFNFTQPTGSYSILLDTVNVPYTPQCNYPSIDTLIQLTTSSPVAVDVNFSVKCKSGFDIGVQSIITTGIVFPGQKHQLKVMAGDMSKWYNLNCASGISGQLVVNISGPVTYISPAPGALIPNISGNTFTYNISDFGNINILNDFNLILKTDSTAATGDSICISTSITPLSGDSDSGNNAYNFCYKVRNSIDPNIKEVYPVNVEPGFHNWFTYTIHFQNTGNAPAMNIRLLDTLDNNLDIETFKVINYSHNNTWVINNKTLFFNFQNIQLPDSTTNPEGSKGFVQYKIKPKSNLGAGTKINNRAYIYFDYNSPIATNTTINNFQIFAGIQEQKLEDNLTIYPNPTNGDFIIESHSSGNLQISIMDITGNLVLETSVKEGKTAINADHLSSGVYTICIKGNVGIINKKLVIVK